MENKEKKNNVNRPNNNANGRPNRKPRMQRQRQPKLYDEEVINIGRVTKVTKGGRTFRFSATR